MSVYDIIVPGVVRQLFEEGYLVVPANCVPSALEKEALSPIAFYRGDDGEFMVDPAKVRPTPKVLIRHILISTSRFTGVSIDDLVGQKRDRDLVHARHCGMYLAVRVYGHGMAAVGRAFGGRDPSTVSNAVSRIEHQFDHRCDEAGQHCLYETLIMIILEVTTFGHQKMAVVP